MALNIPLFDNWFLRSDSSNVILERVSGGRPVEQYFFSSVDGALECFIKRKIRGFDSTSIFGLLQSIKSLQTALNKALQPLDLQIVSLNSSEESSK